MRVISLYQPWATLMVLTQNAPDGTPTQFAPKPIETRSWESDYRGRIGIHAGLSDKVADRLLFEQEPFKSVLQAAGYASWADLPLGALLGSVSMIGCEGFPRTPRRLTRPPFRDIEWPPPEGTLWRAFGDFTPGRYGWLCIDPKKYTNPIPAKGAQGWFGYADDAIRAAMAGTRTEPLKPTKIGK